MVLPLYTCCCKQCQQLRPNNQPYTNQPLQEVRPTQVHGVVSSMCLRATHTVSFQHECNILNVTWVSWRGQHLAQSSEVTRRQPLDGWRRIFLQKKAARAGRVSETWRSGLEGRTSGRASWGDTAALGLTGGVVKGESSRGRGTRAWDVEIWCVPTVCRGTM